MQCCAEAPGTQPLAEPGRSVLDQRVEQAIQYCMPAQPLAEPGRSVLDQRVEQLECEMANLSSKVSLRFAELEQMLVKMQSILPDAQQNHAAIPPTPSSEQLDAASMQGSSEEEPPQSPEKKATTRSTFRASIFGGASEAASSHGILERLNTTEDILDGIVRDEYVWGQSTFDVATFIGTDAMGFLGSVQLVALLIVNVSFQLVFVFICYFNFMEPEIGQQTVQDAKSWRLQTAHTLSQYDEVTKSSLAARVCELDMSLHVSGTQTSLRKNLLDYLKDKPGTFEAFFNGQALCMVAVLTWFLMVFKEMNQAIALIRAIVNLPTGENRVQPVTHSDTNRITFRLVALSQSRKAWCSILFVYRLVAGIMMIIVGTTFLVYTIEVEELILNAVALEIVLDIDDLVFDALCTVPARFMMRNLEPVSLPKIPRRKGLDVKAGINTCLMPIMGIVVYFTMLAPMVETLLDAQHALCGGNLDFAWGRDGRQILHTAPTASYQPWNPEQQILHVKALNEVLWHQADGSLNLRYSMWQRDITSLRYTTGLPLEEVADLYNKKCEDVFPRETVYTEVMRELTGNATLSSCADVKAYCKSITLMPAFQNDGGVGYLARHLCPITCGCMDPYSEFFFITGCAYELERPCSSSKYDHLDLLASRTSHILDNCSQKSPESLRNWPPWFSFVSQIKSYAAVEEDRRQSSSRSDWLACRGLLQTIYRRPPTEKGWNTIAKQRRAFGKNEKAKACSQNLVCRTLVQATLKMSSARGNRTYLWSLLTLCGSLAAVTLIICSPLVLI